MTGSWTPEERAVAVRLERWERTAHALDRIAGGTPGYRVVAAGPGERMTCRYDAAVADARGWQAALRAELGDEADLVDYVPTARDSARLDALWATVRRRDWHPRARGATFGAHLDEVREVVCVGFDERTDPEVVQALRDLGGDDVEVTATGRMSRR